MTQIGLWRSGSSPSNSATNYIAAFNGQTWTATPHLGSTPWAVTGTFKNLSITLASAPGAGNSLTFTLMVNGSDTAMVVTISESATSGSDLINTAAITAGQLVTLKCVPASLPTVSTVQCALDFDSTTVKESGYGGPTTMLVAVTRTNALMWPQNVTNWAGDVSVASVAGTFTALFVAIDVTSSGGAGWTFTILKNGVLQDGAGGTPDTRISLIDAVLTGSSTFSLTVSPGDYFQLRATEVGSAGTMSPAFGVRFVATTDGECMLGGNPASAAGGPSATATEYTRFTGAIAVGASDIDGTEANHLVTVGVSPFTLSALYCLLNLSPNTPSSSYQFNQRKNSGAGTLTATITEPATTASDLVNSQSFVTGNTLDMEIVPTLVPLVRTPAWAAKLTTVNVAIIPILDRHYRAQWS